MRIKLLILVLTCSILFLAGCSSSSKQLAYVTLPQGNSVAAFRLEKNSGNLTPVIGSPFTAGTSPASILIHPSNKFAYVANQTGNDISLFNIDSETGELTTLRATCSSQSIEQPTIFRFIPSTRAMAL